MKLNAPFFTGGVAVILHAYTELNCVCHNLFTETANGQQCAKQH
jgi:hypothetical protein